MAESLYDTDFPNLRKLGFRKASDPAYYNCIAFVAGDYKRKWWPGEYHPYWSIDYWPKEAPNEETLEAFAKALATVGYVPCPDGNWEAGFEKTAIYAVNGLIKHAALLANEKIWKSKLAEDEDIEHTLAGLEGPCYGKVVGYLKRPQKATVKSDPASPPVKQESK